MDGWACPGRSRLRHKQSFALRLRSGLRGECTKAGFDVRKLLIANEMAGRWNAAATLLTANCSSFPTGV